MSTITAWRIEVAPNHWIAIAEKNLIEYINDPKLTYVPLSPKGCDNLIKWKEYLLPVVDLTSKLHLVRGNGLDQDRSTSNKVVVVYMENKIVVNPINSVISIRILSSPERIAVNDDHISSDVSLIPLPLQSSVSSLFLSDNKLTAIHDWKKLLKLFQR
jgi:chemotaxis signal transduction protein